jgi:hypothetical protein
MFGLRSPSYPCINANEVTTSSYARVAKRASRIFDSMICGTRGHELGSKKWSLTFL